MAKTDTQALVPAEAGGELAEVHYLHRGQQDDVEDGADGASSTTAAPAGEDEVLEAEIISEEEYRRLQTQRGQALERYRGYRQDLVTAGRATRTAAAYTRRRAGPPTARVSKFASRHGYYAVAGTWDMVADSYKHLSGRDIDEEIHAARAAGDHGTVATLLSKKQEQNKLRLEYLKVLGKGVLYTPAVVGSGAGVTVAVTLIVSLFAFFRPGGMGFADVWTALAEAVEAGWQWVLFAGGIVPWAAAVALAGIVVTGYNRRRRSGDAPTWAKPTDGGTDGRDVLPTEESILGALRNLGIPKLNEAFKNGWGSAASPTKVWEEPVKRDGQGYGARLRLPQGVTVDAINDKKDVLAHNLTRFPVEVWPTTPKGRPGVMDLWVADTGVLNKPLGPWPWLEGLEEQQADFFSGVPVGTDLRGDQVKAPLFETNYAIAGEMGSGKSSLAMTLVSGAVLDPIVDVDVFVMAENTDFDPLADRLSTLRTGPGDDVIADASAHLKSLYDELEIRGQALKENAKPGQQPPRKTSRALAEADDRLRPRIVVIDECQNLFMNKKHGEEAAAALHQLVTTARKYGIVLILLTPEPSTDSLPRRTMAVINRKACYSIGDQRSNDALLGTGSYKRGEEAVSLEPKTEEDDGDVGTAMTKGFRKKPSLVRFYYITEEQMARVGKRAMELVRGTGGVRTTEVVPETRDLLADLDQVLGEEPVKAKDVASALRQLAPTWKPYEKLNGTVLRKWLWEEYGIHCPYPKNVYHVPPEEVRRELAKQRAAEAGADAQDEPDGDEGDDEDGLDPDFAD